MNKIKRTKPKQAASPRSLDYYQRELLLIIAAARRLLDSMRRAERR